jgi:MoxR-like ATPase
MSLIDMSQFDRVRVTDNRRRAFLGPPPADEEDGSVDPSRGRRRAHDDIDAELAGLGPPSGESAVAIRSYADGHLVMGISGPVDRAMARRIGALLRDLRPHSTRGLLIVLTRLEAWNPHLARVLGQARIHHLIDGGSFELHDAPNGLLVALRADPAFGRPSTAESRPVPGRYRPSDLGRADRSAW